MLEAPLLEHYKLYYHHELGCVPQPVMEADELPHHLDWLGFVDFHPPQCEVKFGIKLNEWFS